jgi:hypothetical protein
MGFFIWGSFATFFFFFCEFGVAPVYNYWCLEGKEKNFHFCVSFFFLLEGVGACFFFFFSFVFR